MYSLIQIGYDRRVRPQYGGPPVSVGVSLYVLSVGEISYKFMDFTFDMYFRWGHTIYHSFNYFPYMFTIIDNSGLTSA